MTAIATSATSAVPATLAAPAHEATWQPVCPLADIWPSTGVCALVQGRQVAIFHLADGRLFALDNHDPKSDANVLSRGIVGDIAGEPVVASPIYKQHYRLRTGECVEEPEITLRTYAVEVRDGMVWVQA
ncbi:nitrite reductase (NAD(P)H) small subunit [Corticibacter populi]|uniref:Nitrite reductase (NAD(P)H) small subunit n=1 Tax=Corticibacter populi TaxID=1550736 RepID=A0A3M6R0G4_9BURK|nr:nitrite reductase small subunit NirD [Corticibacter populi]RMX08695.1 nitrite reductase (NAD(P)H) small subunit [Corticibacter populi]RZS36041.1 assimilatory nitrite reductase (NAD(P)H) small subunit [Corticibacter populi]